MQTLWNRIVQTKRARKYSSCFSSAAACTRRTAIAAFRTRLGSRDRFTVFSSSFLTAATVIDSEIKRGKREKLLGAITEARDELNALDASQKRRLAALSADSDDVKESALSGRRTWEDVLEWAEQEMRARNVLGFADWKGIPLNILEGFSTSQLEDAFRKNSVLRKMLFGADSHAYTTPVRSVKKQKIMEWSTAKLACRFLQKIYPCNASPNDSSPGLGNVPRATDEMIAASAGDAAEADIHIAKLRTLPSYTEDVKEVVSPNVPRYTLHHRHNKDKVAVLNSSLHEVFQLSHTQEKEIRFLITNICHHLLASNAPPTIQTYTLLARNFEKLGEHALVKVIMDAVHECRFRLDEEALTFWLNYYATTDNIEGFQKLVSQMHGFGHGLCPAHHNNIVPGIAFNQNQFGHYENGSSRNPSTYEYSTASHREFFASKHLDFIVFRAARKNQDVYGSLIRGTLKLLGDEKAMDNYIDMIREGHEPTVELLTSILHQCCNTKDWRSGLGVLQKIHAIAGANLQTYRLLLRLCQKCQDGDRFKKALTGGIRRGVISPAVQYFPEQIEAMQADQLLDLASAYDDCVQRAEDKNTVSRSPERLARWLGLIGHQMAEAAFEFGILTLSADHRPAKGFFLYTRIKYHRADLLGWAEGRENQTSPFLHDMLSLSPATPGALNDAPSGTYEVLHKLEVPCFSGKTPSSMNQAHIRTRGKRTSVWDPLLRMLASDVLKLGVLLSKLAQQVGDIELSIRHRPAVGRVLHVRMLPSRKKRLGCADLTPQTPSSRQEHKWSKEKKSAHLTIQDTESGMLMFKKIPYQEKVRNDEHYLTKLEPDRELSSETRCGTRDLESPLKKGNKARRFPIGMGNVLQGWKGPTQQ